MLTIIWSAIWFAAGIAVGVKNAAKIRMAVDRAVRAVERRWRK